MTAEWLPENFKVFAYTAGERWNGWQMPRFELVEALRLLEHLPNLSYDSARDVFVASATDEDGEDEVFAPTTLALSAGPVTVYPIGAGCWTWELAD